MKVINDKGRTCTKCGSFKDWEHFSDNNKKNAPYQKSAKCKECTREDDKLKRVKLQKEQGITESGRICTKCNTFKPWVDFPENKSKKNNIHPRCCKLCLEESKTIASKKSRDLKQENWELWQARALRSRWLARFKKHYPNQPYDSVPTAKEIESWLKTKELVCYFTDQPLSKESINFDHITPVSRGGSFGLDNIALVTPEVNQIKGELNEEEFKQLLALTSSWEDQGKYLKQMLKRASMVFVNKFKRK